jgi:peptidoglycan glycosyltransferase/penicillin-binding protein 2
LQKGKPVFLARDLNKWQVEALQPYLREGLMVVREKLRYRQPALAPHLLGYLRTADQTGVTGIEALADEELSHVEPVKLAAIVDGNRKLIPGLGYRIIGGQGEAGASLSTTLDSEIQRAAQDELVSTGQRGAVVIVEAGSGNVLAAASNPTFDPNQVETAFQAPNAPLLNRAIHDYYPGSVFKIVVTAAALEEQVTSLEEQFFDPGYYDVGTVRFRCWLEGGHGHLDLTGAFAQSCNSVYVELGQKLGLGSKTGIGLPEEQQGSLPAGGRFSRQDFGNMALGQRGIKATPMQLAKLMVTILQGRATKLNLFPGQESYGGAVLSAKTRAALRAMMAAVVERGTGTQAQIPGYGAGGKTGSAQTGRLNSWGEPEVDAWFAGFFPLLQPRYVIVVLLEGGASGSIAAGIFKRIALRIT